MKRSLLLLSLICLFSYFCYGVSSFDGVAWISVDKSMQKDNQWICFRKSFELKKLPEQSELKIAVDSKYWLWVNDRLVVFEGGLKRGPNPNDTYYDEVDLKPYLNKGKNTIAVLMWYFGKQGFCHNSSGESGLIATLSLGEKVLVTDASWKAMIHPAFGETGEPYPNPRLPESNVHYDARKAKKGWSAKHYDDSAWDNAVVRGCYPCAPWNKLHRRPFPVWKDFGVVNYVNVTKRIEGDKLIVTGILPKNITVTPYLKISSPSGLRIDIRADNYKGGSEYNVRGEYITCQGVQKFEMPNYINGHTVIYTMPKDVECLELGYRETAFNTEHLGSFRCSDEFYNRLWQKALNTMSLNMRDAIQDADRERSQWWGDAVIVEGEILYSCDTNGYNAIKKAILNLADWQKPEGVLFSPVPTGLCYKELPLQMLAAIGKFGFWNYYWYTKDIETIRHAYPAVKRYLSLWKIEGNGLVKHRDGNWSWGDWGWNIDHDILDNAWFCLALESAENMGRLLHDERYADSCATTRSKIQQAATRILWNGTIFRSPKYTSKTDDRANGMAILAGFADEKQQGIVADSLTTNFRSSPYMEKYILESFFIRGDVNRGLERMKTRYCEMVDHEFTTLWEDWRIGGAGGGSINHGWAGGPLTLLSQYVAGIYPTKAGWERFMIKPQLGSLEWVECTVPIFNKTVTANIRQDYRSWSLSVRNNSGKECVVAVPKLRMKSHFEINRITVVHNESLIDNKFVKEVDSDSLYVYLLLKKDKVDIVLK